MHACSCSSSPTAGPHAALAALGVITLFAASAPTSATAADAPLLLQRPTVSRTHIVFA